MPASSQAPSSGLKHLVQFLQELIAGPLAETQNATCIERPFPPHTKRSDLENGVFILDQYLLNEEWLDAAAVESGALEFLVRLVDKGALVLLSERFRPEYWRYVIDMLRRLIELYSNGKRDNPKEALAQLSWGVVCRFLDLVQAHPVHFLCGRSSNYLFSGIMVPLVVQFSDRYPPASAYFRESAIAQRVILFGRLLADDSKAIQAWNIITSFLLKDWKFPNEKSCDIICRRLVDLSPLSIELLFLRGTRGATSTTEVEIAVPMDVLMILLYSRSAEFRSLFWEKIVSPLIQFAWKRIEVGTRDTSTRLSDALFVLLRLGLRGENQSNKQTVTMCKLLAQKEIISLLSRNLYASVSQHDPALSLCSRDFIRNFVLWLKEQRSPSSPDDLAATLRPSMIHIFLPILDAVRLVPPNQKTESSGVSKPALFIDHLLTENFSEIDAWTHLGFAIGLDEPVMRLKRKAASLSENELLGCSWKRCALYGQESHAGMLLCSGCLKVQYCPRSECQRRHWHDGGHKGECLADT